MASATVRGISIGSPPVAPSLRRRAFHEPYNLIGLGAAVVYSFALWTPWPAIVGAIGELAWMTVGATSGWFRRLVDREQAAAIEWRRKATQVELVRGLDSGYEARVTTLQALAVDLRNLLRERGIAATVLGATPRSEDLLDQLIAAFVKMSFLHQRLSRFVADANPAELTADTERLTQALASEKDPAVRLSVRQALTLGQRRQKAQETIDAQRRALGVKMNTLEMAFDFLRSQAFAATPAQELAAELQEMVGGANFIGGAEAEANALLARLATGGTSITRTVTVAASD